MSLLSSAFRKLQLHSHKHQNEVSSMIEPPHTLSSGSSMSPVNGISELVPSIQSQSVPKTNGTTSGAPVVGGYEVQDVLMGTKRKLRIIFMGMGCSGINFAHHLFQKMENMELTVYEKNVRLLYHPS